MFRQVFALIYLKENQLWNQSQTETLHRYIFLCSSIQRFAHGYYQACGLELHLGNLQVSLQKTDLPHPSRAG